MELPCDGNDKSQQTQQQARIDTISTRRHEQTYKQTEGHHHRVMAATCPEQQER